MTWYTVLVMFALQFNCVLCLDDKETRHVEKHVVLNTPTTWDGIERVFLKGVYARDPSRWSFALTDCHESNHTIVRGYEFNFKDNDVYEYQYGEWSPLNDSGSILEPMINKMEDGLELILRVSIRERNANKRIHLKVESPRANIIEDELAIEPNEGRCIVIRGDFDQIDTIDTSLRPQQ